MADSTMPDDQPGDAPPPPPPPPPLSDDAIVYTLGGWQDFSRLELMLRVARANCANLTGQLGWNDGAQSLGGPFTPIDSFGNGEIGYCDNFVLECIVPDYQVQIYDDPEKPKKDCRSQKYTELGVRTTKIREILSDHHIPFAPSDVSPTCLYDISKVPDSLPNREDYVRLPDRKWVNAVTVPGVDPAKRVGKWFKQLIIVHVPDACMQTVIDLIRSGEFAKWGLYLHDFDVTVDMLGSFTKRELKAAMLQRPGWQLEKHGKRRYFKSNTILDNSHYVGENCMTWMVSVNVSGVEFDTRDKFYLKIVQEFEKQKVRSEVGQQLANWIEAVTSRLAFARNKSTESGLTRCEATVYFNKWAPHKAHEMLPKTAAEVTSICVKAMGIAPPNLLYRQPHNQMVANWAANLKHILVVADALYDCALVVYGVNEVTDAVSATKITNWKRRSRYVLQRLAMGRHPVDLVVINRSSKYDRQAQAMPGGVHRTKRRKLARSQYNRFVDIDADSFDQLMLEDVGVKVGDDSDTESESGSEVSDSGSEVSDSGDDSELEEEEDESDAIAADTQPDDAQQPDVEAQQDEVDDDEGTETASTATVEYSLSIPGRMAVEPGCIAFVTRRYHRFNAKDAEASVITELPRSGQLGHYFNPRDADLKHLVPSTADLDAEAFKAAKAEAIADLIERKCEAAGFRPLDNLNGLHVQPRKAKFTVGNKRKDITLRECSSKLDLDLACIRPATKPMAWGLTKKQLDAHKAILLAERQRLRLVNIAQGASERQGLAVEQTNMIAASALRDALKLHYSGNRASSIRDLEPAVYDIVAIQRNTSTFVLFLRDPDDADAKIKPCASLKPIDTALTAHRATLDSQLMLIEPDSSGRAYIVNPQFTTEAIGSLAIDSETINNGHGRQVPKLRLVVAGVEMLAPVNELVDSLATAMEVDGEGGSSSGTAVSIVPTSLAVTDAVKRDAAFIHDSFTVKKGDHPIVLCVRAASVTAYKGHSDKLVMSAVPIDMDGEPTGDAKLFWGGPTLNAMATQVHDGCKIVVYQTKAKAYHLDCGVIPESEHSCWTMHLPRSYDDLPTIKLGMESPAAITIARVGLHRANSNPVIQDNTGKVWKFAAPQNIKSNPAKNQPGIMHMLVPNAVLNTAKPKLSVTPPP
jgi:hypothetical protein